MNKIIIIAIIVGVGIVSVAAASISSTSDQDIVTEQDNLEESIPEPVESTGRDIVVELKDGLSMSATG